MQEHHSIAPVSWATTAPVFLPIRRRRIDFAEIIGEIMVDTDDESKRNELLDLAVSIQKARHAAKTGNGKRGRRR